MSDDDLAGDAHIKIKEIGPQGHGGNKMFIIITCTAIFP